VSLEAASVEHERAVPCLVPRTNRRTLRRTLVWAGIAALLGSAALVLTGHWRMALLGCLGIALGAVNSWQAARSVARFSDGGAFRKARFTASVFGRLGVITVIALGCAITVRPDGLAVFMGLAVFQLLTIMSASLPLVKEIRQQ